MKRRLILMVVLLIAVPLIAQEKRRVSKIDVRGNVPAHIVTTQSAIETGRDYSEKDLEVAVARLRRLPFVFDARYSLDGETLVIEVDAVTRFFGDLEASAVGFESNETVSGVVGGGGRMFLGSGGVLQGRVAQSVSDFDDATSLDAEYAHYGIGGTRFFAVAGINYSAFNDDDGFEPDPGLRVLAGYPLNVRNTLTASITDEGYTSRRSIPAAPGRVGSSADSRTLNLRWTYDTTEDPFFARHGLMVSAGPSWAHDESRFQAPAVTFPGGVVTILNGYSETRSTALIADALKYWAFRERGAFFGAANLTVSRDDREQFLDGSILRSGESDSTSARLQVGYAHNLFDRVAGNAQTRHRLEFAAGYARQELNQLGSPYSRSVTINSTALSAAYVLRRNFATVRLGLSYAFD